MKTSYVISVSPTRFTAVTYAPDLENKFKRIAELGFDGVEVHLRDPKEVDAGLVRRLAAENGLAIPAVGTGQAYVEDGLSFSDPDPSVRAAAVQRLKDDIVFTSEIGSPIVIVGLLRGKTPDGLTRPQAIAWTRESLQECIPLAADKGIRIVIEPINRYETDIFNSVSGAMDFLRHLDSPHAGLLVDTFHMNIEEPSIYASIRYGNGTIAHVHAVDSNRWSPGSGHLNFNEIVETLQDIGYDGYLSAEILPLPDSDTAAQMTIRTLTAALGTLRDIGTVE